MANDRKFFWRLTYGCSADSTLHVGAIRSSCARVVKQSRAVMRGRKPNDERNEMRILTNARVKAHPAADLFPLLAEAELEDLARDIKAHGQLLPIITWHDLVVDGRNRNAACELAGKEPRFEARNFKDDNEVVQFIVSANLKRRHLNASQRAAIGARLATLPAHRPGKGGKFAGLSQKESAQLLNVGERSVRSARRVLASGDDSLVSAVDAGKVAISIAAQLARLPKKEQAVLLASADRGVLLKAARELKAADRVQRRREKEERSLARLKKSHPLNGKSYKLIHADVLDALPQIEPASVDLILTDLPYANQFLDCYDKLGEFARAVLKPTGLLLAMTGQAHLPEVLRRLCQHGLIYHWTLAYVMPARFPLVFGRKVSTNWKPVFMFTPNGHYTGESFPDLVTARDRPDKRFHIWQQSEDGMRQLIERYTAPGEMVVDPFCGSGTTGVAAVRLGRLFIGVDSDASAIATSAERLAAAGASSASSVENPHVPAVATRRGVKKNRAGTRVATEAFSGRVPEPVE